MGRVKIFKVAICDLKEYLSTYDISFLIRSDLNNDGKEEKVTLYRQWDGEDPGWSDDQWYIICIFIVSLEQAQCWDAQTQVYGWKEGSYRFMGEVEG